MKLTVVLLLTLMTLGCGYGSKYNMMGTTVQMSELSPQSANAGEAGFMLTVNGSGFSMNSMVYWNSMPLTTRFISGNQLVAGVPAFQVAMPGAVQVYVYSNGMASNVMNFTVSKASSLQDRHSATVPAMAFAL